MNKLSSFPKDPAKSLIKMSILIDLESAVSDKRGFFADSIREALDAEGPKDDLLDMLKAQAADSYWEVADIVGYKLLDKIIAFK